MDKALKIMAPAKVNWFLEIRAKREDGFHELETVLQAVDLFDELELTEIDSPEIRFSCDIDLGDPKQNLVYRAAEMFRQRFAPEKGAAIHLKKIIPHGAGLGGGSSDAANSVVGLNKLWSIGAIKSDIERLVGEIGSDCAFFVDGGTSFCTGRGEIIASMPDAEMCDIVLLYPQIVCSTAQVYSNLAQVLTFVPKYCYLFHGSEGRPNCTEISDSIFNRLQESALAVSGGLSETWNRTSEEAGVLSRFVSGSGSTIAFLMAGRERALKLRHSLDQRNLGRVFAVQTLKRGTVWG